MQAHYIDLQTVEEFRRRQVEVEELKKVIQQKSNQERNVDDKIRSIFNEWEPKLNQLVETISSKFSDFMESISYVGEVVLSRKEKVCLLCVLDIYVYWKIVTKTGTVNRILFSYTHTHSSIVVILRFL